MLAGLRCNELKIEAIKEFQIKIQSIGKQIGKIFVTDLGRLFGELFDETLRAYDEHGSDYFEATYRQIRDELCRFLFDHSKDLFNAQMKFIVNASIQKIKDLFSSRFSSGQAAEFFSEAINEIESTIRDEFIANENSIIVEGSSWDITEYQEEIEKFLLEKIEGERNRQLYLLDKEIESKFTGKFTAEVWKILEGSMDYNIWDKLKGLQEATMEPIQLKSETTLRSLGKSNAEFQIYIHQIKVKCIEVIRAKIDKFIKNLEEFLTKKFNNLFNKDSKGIPRDPKSTNYEEVFSTSKSKVLPILDQFKYFLLTPDWDLTDDNNHEELLGEENFEKIMDNFLKDAERTYKDALHIKEFGYNRGGLPKWCILLMMVLGWNEFMWILTSPIILYPVMFIGSIIALLFSMGLGAVPKLIFSQVLNKVPFLS